MSACVVSDTDWVFESRNTWPQKRNLEPGEREFLVDDAQIDRKKAHCCGFSDSFSKVWDLGSLVGERRASGLTVNRQESQFRAVRGASVHFWPSIPKPHAFSMT